MRVPPNNRKSACCGDPTTCIAGQRARVSEVLLLRSIHSDIHRKEKYPLGKGYVKPVSKLIVKEHMDTEIWFLGDTVH